jgi:putative hydrolase of the HAD superfamily
MLNPASNSRDIRAVILDYGGVLSLDAAPEVTASMANLLNIPPARFHELYHRTRLEYDRGDLSAAEYWSGLASHAGVRLEPAQIEELRHIDVAMWSNVNQNMLRWVVDLRSGGVKTALLSNMHSDMVSHVRQHFDWLKSFDCVVLSSELRMVKPGPEIFHHCLKCLGVAPREALFIDDREANVRGAEAVGIKGLMANSVRQVREGLESIDFAPVPPND